MSNTIVSQLSALEVTYSIPKDQCARFNVDIVPSPVGGGRTSHSPYTGNMKEDVCFGRKNSKE